MTDRLSLWLWLAGMSHFGILIASFSVPLVMDWRKLLEPLPKLMRQLIWVYGAYVVLMIISLGGAGVFLSDELAAGTPLARAVCGFATIFWGIRLSLQFLYFDSQEFRTTWWLDAGYYGLTVVFTLLTGVFAVATFA